MDTQTLSPGSGVNSAPIRKNVGIREVENGFVVELGYGQVVKIAKDKEEVLQFISEFLG